MDFGSHGSDDETAILTTCNSNWCFPNRVSGSGVTCGRAKRLPLGGERAVIQTVKTVAIHSSRVTKQPPLFGYPLIRETSRQCLVGSLSGALAS